MGGTFQIPGVVEELMGIFDLSFGGVTLASVLKAVLIFLVCLISIKILMTLICKALEKSRLDETLRGFVRTGAKALLWVLAVIIVADAIGIDTASLVAVVSVAGLALSLAVQNIMSNIFSGITLLITRPFSAGDYVSVGGNEGTVKNVGLFYTVIDTVDNKLVSIPNSDITASAVINYSTEPLRRVDMTFNTGYKAEPDKVRAAINAAAAKDERIMKEPAPVVYVSAYRDSTVEYVVRLWCKNEDYWAVYYGMNEAVRESFKKHGVPLSYAHMNVHVV